MGHDLTLTEALLNQLGDRRAAQPGAGWEVGRLVLAPAYRRDVDALRRCLYLALRYASANGVVDDLYASCTHALSRLYRRFAFLPIAPQITLAGTDKAYTLIHGRASQVLMSLSDKPEGSPCFSGDRG